MATAAQVIALAKTQVGVHEIGSTNNVKYNTFYYGHAVSGASTYPWCATFTSWVFNKAGMTKSQYAFGAYTPSQASWYKSRGRWHTGKPKPGDVAFYDFGLGRISHTGIVVKGLGKKHHTAVEGNTSGSGSQRNGGQVCLKTRSGSSIVGYGRPYYGAASSTSTTTAPKKGIEGMALNEYKLVPMTVAKDAEKTLSFDKGKTNGYALVSGEETVATVNLQIAPGFTGHGQVQFFELTPNTSPGTLKNGSTGASVTRVQKKVGVAADGEFGPNTKKAVEAWQKKQGWASNGGVVGPGTWAAMFPPVVKRRYRPVDFDGADNTGNLFVQVTQAAKPASGIHLRVSVTADQAMEIAGGDAFVLH